MRNEELAALAKAGDKKALHQLWEQNRGLLALLFRKLTANENNLVRMKRAGVTYEDIEQVGYFAIIQAVEAFDEAAGAQFNSFLRFPVMTQFFELIGFRTEKQKKEPLSQCCSLDEQLNNSEGETFTRSDTVPDIEAEKAFDGIEERLYHEQLKRDLDEVLGMLEPEQEEAIRKRYYDGLTRKQAGEQMNINAQRVQFLEDKGLKTLRRYSHTKLKNYRDELISTRSWQRVGFGAWKHGGSIEERIVEQLEAKGL